MTWRPCAAPAVKRHSGSSVPSRSWMPSAGSSQYCSRRQSLFTENFSRHQAEFFGHQLQKINFRELGKLGNTHKRDCLHCMQIRCNTVDHDLIMNSHCRCSPDIIPRLSRRW